MLQLEQARPFALMHGWDLDADASLAHADLDVSGWRKSWRKRAGLAVHLSAAERGEFQHLIVYKLSRLARSAREGLEIFAAFEALGVAIHVVKEGIDSSTATGRMLRTIMLAVAELEAENISQFATDAIAERVRQGKPHATPPFWIRKQDDGSYALDPVTAPIVQRLVALRLEGRGHMAIARAMNADNLRTARGGDWTEVRVRHYLTEDYIDRMDGAAVWGRQAKATTDGRIPNAWPRLIDDETSAALRLMQKRLAPANSEQVGNRTGHNQHTRSRALDTPFLVSSLSFCALCGSQLTSRYSGGKNGKNAGFRAYICHASLVRDDRARHNGQGGINVVATALEDAVVRVLRRALVTPPPKLAKPAPSAAAGTGKGKRARTAAQITEEIDRLLAAWLSGALPQSDYDRNLARLLQEREAAQQAEIQAEAPAVYQMVRSVIGADLETSRDDDAEAAARLWRQIILQMVERIDVPITLPGWMAATRPRRIVRVTLLHATAEGRVFLAPLYYAGWRGARGVLDADGDLLPELFPAQMPRR